MSTERISDIDLRELHRAFTISMTNVPFAEVIVQCMAELQERREADKQPVYRCKECGFEHQRECVAHDNDESRAHEEEAAQWKAKTAKLSDTCSIQAAIRVDKFDETLAIRFQNGDLVTNIALTFRGMNALMSLYASAVQYQSEQLGSKVKFWVTEVKASDGAKP